MLLTNDKEAAEKTKKWSTQSRDVAPWYQHSEIGYNYRLSNVDAGVVRGQFLHLEEHIAKKKAIYERYKDGFKELPIQMNPYEENICEPNYWLSCMTINPEAMCIQNRGDYDVTYVSEVGKSCPTEILEALAAINVEGRPIWKPMHMQPVFKDKEFVTRNDDGKHDVGRDLFQRGLCLPSDINMTVEQQDTIIEVVKACFG